MKLVEKIQEVQKEIPKISKEKQGYNYKYFDINQILDVLKPVCAKHKVLVTQPMSHIDGKPALKLVVTDLETGETIEDITPLTDNSDPQKMGSAVTYFRRYSLVSFFELEAEDDDGASAKPSPSNVDTQDPVSNMKRAIEACSNMNQLESVEERIRTNRTIPNRRSNAGKQIRDELKRLVQEKAQNLITNGAVPFE